MKTKSVKNEQNHETAELQNRITAELLLVNRKS